MKLLKLHVGCASIRLEGYLNIDCRKTVATDYVCPASKISMVPLGTVGEVYSRHMLEHLEPNEAKLTLLHWYELLAPGAFIHIVVPDIEFHAKQILGLAKSNLENQLGHAFAGFWGWHDNLRGGSNEDAHRWGYTEETLRELLTGLGFVDVQRKTSGIDTEPWHLNFLAYKPNLMENIKKKKRVSVVIPAYKPDYFSSTLEGLLSQTYPHIELIIHDDSSGSEIADIVESKRTLAGFPIRYIRNEVRVGEEINTAKGILLAQGEYIKILHDDDVLEPGCIAEMVSVIESIPNISLVSSKRVRVNECLENLPDILATRHPFSSDVVIKGKQLVSFLADNTINFIGEPSCILARRKDFLEIADQLMSLNGKLIHWVGDLAIYAKLLQRGDLALLSKPLVKFRVSTQQFSQLGREQPGIGEQGHADFRQAIRELGWYRATGDNNIVEIADLTADREKLPFRSVDLLERLCGTVRNVESQEASVSTWLAGRVINPRQQVEFDQVMAQLPKPSWAILLLGHGSNPSELAKTKRSLQEQNTTDIQFDLHVIEGADITNQINNWLESSTQEWFLLLRTGDELSVSGLLMVQIELAQNPPLSAISFDEVYRQENGQLGAALRPSVNLDYLLSFPAGMSKHWLFKCAALREIGGFRPEFTEAFELDAILRLINIKGLTALGHVAEPLVISAPPVLQNLEGERNAIEQHLRERGYSQGVLHAPNPGRYQVRYQHSSKPVVSVIIAAKQSLQNLQRCVEGLLSNTNYQNFEIIFVQQPDSSTEVGNWLGQLATMQEPKLRVFITNHRALSMQLNEVRQKASGDYLLFLSADVAVINSSWLDEMLNHAQRSEVGIVGAKLLSPNGKILHAGYILGLEGPVSSPFVGEPFETAGYMQRLQVDQNLSAVGGDCFLILHELFIELGGFSQELDEYFISTDLCLRAGHAGFLIVWTPHAQLMLDRQKEIRVNSDQQDAMYAKWLPQLARDPAYNPNFSLAKPGGYQLADNQISWRPLDDFRSVPVALIHPADLFGCGHYRMIQPFLAMKDSGLLDGAISTGLMHVTDLERYNPDSIVLQRQIGDERLEAMQRMQRFSRAFKVYELDDYLPNLPMKSVHRESMPKDIVRSLRRGLSFVDRFVVSTDMLAEAFSGLHGEIVVRENRLPLNWWQGLGGLRRQSRKPRVGWAGGASHTGDLELISDVVRDLADEVEWVFFGMCPDKLRPYIHEFHKGVGIEEYPSKLAALNLDLGLAPVEINLFNECKSNLRQLEYGACGIPVICTDIQPYRLGQEAGLPVTLVKNRYKNWVDAIRMHIYDLDSTAKMADELQAKVLADWMLQGEYLECWKDAWISK